MDYAYRNQTDTFSITHRKALSHHMPNHHFHSTYELYYLVSGERRVFIKDRILEIEEGDLVLIHPNVLHKTTNADLPKHERIIINFHEGFLMQHPSSFPALSSLLRDEYIIINFSLYNRRIYVEEVLRNILQEVQQLKTGFEVYAQTLLLQLLIFLCRFIEENHSVKPLPFNSPIHKRITEVVRYINEHYPQDISLHYLAERFFISPYYLSRVFKEATGFSYVEYLNTVRIKEAIKLLEQSRMKVSQIAEKTGFGSITHFGRVFKEITGHTPLYYRK